MQTRDDCIRFYLHSFHPPSPYNLPIVINGANFWLAVESLIFNNYASVWSVYQQYCNWHHSVEVNFMSFFRRHGLRYSGPGNSTDVLCVNFNALLLMNTPYIPTDFFY